MALPGGFPSIRLEGDKEAASLLIPEAKRLLVQVQRICESSGASTYSMTTAVGMNGYVMALQSYGQSILTCVSFSQEEDEPSVLTYTGIPDFWSGCFYEASQIKTYEETDPVTKQKIEYEAVQFAPTYDAAYYFAPPPPPPQTEKEPVVGRQKNRRLILRSDSKAFPEANSAPEGLYPRGQCRFLRPSMWSGTMAKVVSVIMGYGKMPKYKLSSPNYKIPDGVGVVKYDYKFARTHGIFLGESNPALGPVHVEPWLIEISISRGVLAMPLEIFPTGAGSKWGNKLDAKRYGTVGSELVELIGGMPSGRGFPVGDALIEAIEAGTVLQLLKPEELNDFYVGGVQHSSALGWAFNDKGSEAHNTMWKWGDDGIRVAHWYQISIDIGSLLDKTKLKPGDPIAIGTAKLKKQAAEPYCYGSSNGRTMMPFKVWEPLVNDGYGGLLSVEGLDWDNKGHGTRKIYSDAPMFVCFQNDELKVVRFFHDGRDQPYIFEVPSEAQENPPFSSFGCIVFAQMRLRWEEQYGYPIISPFMYTNDIDERIAYTPTFHTKYLAFGYLDDGQGLASGEAQPVCSDTLENPAWGGCAMQRWYGSFYEDKEEYDKFVNTAVVIPAYSRSAFFYSKGSYKKGTHTTQFYSVHGYFSETFTYFRAGTADFGTTPYHDPGSINKMKCFMEYVAKPQGGGQPLYPGLRERRGHSMAQYGGVAPSNGALFGQYGCNQTLPPPLIGSCEPIGSVGGGWFTGTYMSGIPDPPPTYTGNKLHGWVAAYNEADEYKAELIFFHPEGRELIEGHEYWDHEMIRSPSPDPDDGVFHHWYASYSVWGEWGTTFYDNLLERGGKVVKRGRVPGSTDETVDEVVAFVGYNNHDEKT